MTRLSWDNPETRFFDTGLDRGVLYPKKTPPPGKIVATNLLPNPSFETNVTGYDGTVDVSQDTGWAAFGLASMALTVESGSTNDSRVSVRGDAGALRLGMQAGKTYTITGTVNTPVALTGALHTFARSIVAYTRVGSDPYVTTASNAGPVVGTDRIRVTFTVPSGATEAFIRLYNGSSVAGEVVRWDDLAFFEGAKAFQYFDGDFADSDLFTYEWAGTPHASLSYKRERSSTAVPWNGLTGVDENGAEAATAYYIDGQPFLYLPKPKPFQATLKAYTYPDEFAELMGLAEVADGMYLDSQMGDTFDLSYRTLVGNSIEGTSHGYKIHLVYNVTVAPQSVSYAPVTNTVNPTEFAWDVQAVPIAIEGYLPTAHIVIDTRHMDSNKLSEIEALLYGDDMTLPSMPRPSTVLDLLSYGDAVVIIDNGDGTWTAEGSYLNVYLTDGDGNFEIDNIYAIHYADGHYILSDEPIESEILGITEFIDEPINY